MHQLQALVFRTGLHLVMALQIFVSTTINGIIHLVFDHLHSLGCAKYGNNYVNKTLHKGKNLSMVVLIINCEIWSSISLLCVASLSQRNIL